MTNYNEKDLFNALWWAVDDLSSFSKEHVENLNRDPIEVSGDNDWILEGLNHIMVMVSFMANMNLTTKDRAAVDGILATLEKRKEIIEAADHMKEHYDKLQTLLAD